MFIKQWLCQFCYMVVKNGSQPRTSEEELHYFWKDERLEKISHLRNECIRSNTGKL